MEDKLGFMILVCVLVFVYVYFFRPDIVDAISGKFKDTTTTSDVGGSFSKPKEITTTIPTSTSCKLFDMKIDDVKEFDEEGKNKIVVVDLTATYTGNRENQYYEYCIFPLSGMGCYGFELQVNKGYYYELKEYYDYCPYEKVFRLNNIMPEDVISGCLAFETLDDTKPAELIFYDKTLDDTCHIPIR